MALSITPVTANQVSASSGVANSTTSFSPGAGSMVRVCVGWLLFSNTLGGTLTCKDSLNNAYTSAAQTSDGFGSTYAAIFDRQYASAPGSITVTVTSSITGVSADVLLEPFTITGQSVTQAGAASATNNTQSSSSTCEISLTTTQTGSYVFAAGAPNFNSTPTAVAGFSTTATWNDSSAGDQAVLGHTTSAGGAPGSVTVGWTVSPASAFGYGIAAAEVIPAGTSLVPQPYRLLQAVKRSNYY